MHQIASKMNVANITTKRGVKWQASGVSIILHNIVYTGTMIFQRYFNDEQFKKRKIMVSFQCIVLITIILLLYRWKNMNEYKKLFESGQLQKEIMGDGKNTNRYAFSKKVLCDKCGNTYKRIQTYWKGNTKKVQ